MRNLSCISVKKKFILRFYEQLQITLARVIKWSIYTYALFHAAIFIMLQSIDTLGMDDNLIPLHPSFIEKKVSSS